MIIGKSVFLSVDKINRFPFQFLRTGSRILRHSQRRRKTCATKSVFENKSSPQLHCIKIWSFWTLLHQFVARKKELLLFVCTGPLLALISQGGAKEIWITTGASSLYHCHLKHAHLWILEVLGVSQPSQWWCLYSWPVPHTPWKTKNNLK